MIPPAIAATAKLAQVHGSISRENELNGRSLFAIPRSLKSTRMIVPSTRVSAITCTVSTVGNSQTDSRTCTASAEFSMAASIDSDIGNPTTGGGYCNPQNENQHAEEPGNDLTIAALAPVIRI